MKNTFYTILFLFTLTAFSQHKEIEITNTNNGKIKIFNENVRLKIRTLDRKKHVGKIHFLDNQTIIIGDEYIKTDSILSIKRQPLFLGTAKTILLIAGFSNIATSLVTTFTAGNTPFLFFTIGSGAIISTGLIENINSKHSNKKWTYKIIEK